MEAEGGLRHRLSDLQKRLKDMEDRVRGVVSSSGWPPSHLHFDRLQSKGAGKISVPYCRECKVNFGSKWLRDGCCWRCRAALRDSGRCTSSKSPLCMVCPHRRACFACDGISCSACGVVRSVAIESDGSLFDWLFQLDPQPQTLFLDFDATLCSTASGCAPQVGKHALHGELAAVVESGAFQIVIVTKQNPQHHRHIVVFLEALGWKEGREYELHCIGGTGVRKSSVIQECMRKQLQQSDTHLHSVFIDDSIKEILQARSELPLSVTMLVFAAAKSSYDRTLVVKDALVHSEPLFSTVSAAHLDEAPDKVDANLSISLQTAERLENVLGVKVDLSSPASPVFLSVHTTPTAELSTSVALAIDTDGPESSLSSETETVRSSSASTESGAGNSP